MPELKKYITDEHRTKQDTSKLVCRYYRDGKCLKGDSCGYSHVGFVRKNVEVNKSSRPTQKSSTCRHGVECSWLARGQCSFFHQGVGVQKPRQQGVRQNSWKEQKEQSIPSNPLRCPRGAACIHLARGSCNYGGVFYHVNQEAKEQEKEENFSRSRREQETRLCWEDENCKRTSCHFVHMSLQNFPNLPQPSRPTRNQTRFHQ